jgi:hypothetical protein
MNEKRSFFRVHLITVMVGTLLCAAYVLVQRHEYVVQSCFIHTYTPEKATRKHLAITGYVELLKGWPRNYQIARVWGFHRKDELSATFEAEEAALRTNFPGSGSNRELNMDELAAFAPAIRASIPVVTDSCKGTQDYLEREYHEDVSAHRYNLIAWGIALAVLCVAIEDLLRRLRLGESSRLHLSAKLTLNGLRFSLLTSLVFSVTLGATLALCYRTSSTTDDTFAFEPPFEDLRNDGDQFFSFHEYSKSKGWPFAHEVVRRNGYFHYPLNASEAIAREAQAIREHVGWKPGVLGVLPISTNNLRELAPKLYSATAGQFDESNWLEHEHVSNALFAQNIAFCIGTALLISILAETVQRLRARRKVTPLLFPSPQSPAQ